MFFNFIGVKKKKEKQYSLFNAWILILGLKLLLSCGYYSTDFDVHRNWKSLTNILPMNKWYVADKSKWTLDYPPFFAYFEFFWSKLTPKSVIKDGLFDITCERYGYKSVLFQRLTVIASEVLLFVSLQWYVNSTSDEIKRKKNFLVALSLVLSPGLIIIDHIHFQYNGFLLSFLILAINCARLKKYLQCGFWFLVLLCLKHIYFYISPVFFIFLFKSYCLKNEQKKKKKIAWKNFGKLSSTVLVVFLLAFGPFIFNSTIKNVFQRLFPFNRGLIHMYWAPNFWSLYSTLDRLLVYFVSNFTPLINLFSNVNFENLRNNNFVSLMKEYEDVKNQFFLFPNIKPWFCFLLTFLFQLIPLILLFIKPTFKIFLENIVICGFSSFLFGWHVHEKAILLTIFPLSFLVINKTRLYHLFKILTCSSFVSFFPLIILNQELLISVLYTLIWLMFFFPVFKDNFSESKTKNNLKKFDLIERLYLLFLTLIIIFYFFSDFLRNKFSLIAKFEFFKIMLISVYCSVGVLYSFSHFYIYFIQKRIKLIKKISE